MWREILCKIIPNTLSTCDSGTKKRQYIPQNNRCPDIVEVGTQYLLNTTHSRYSLDCLSRSSHSVSQEIPSDLTYSKLGVLNFSSGVDEDSVYSGI